MENDKPITTMCGVVAMDHSSFCYRVCSICERSLPDNPSSSLCKFCNFNAFNPGFSSSKRLFRLLVSTAACPLGMNFNVSEYILGCSGYWNSA